MTTVTRIVCFANSRKLNGRCIAGVALSHEGEPAGWIRPISAREHEEVSEYERQYQNGSDPRVLDIMDVPLLEPRPKGYQQENWLLDPDQYWRKIGHVTWGVLNRYETKATTLWVNGHHTYSGMNDSIPLGFVGGIKTSLCLVRVPSVALHVFAPGEAFGNAKRRVQGRFRLNGSEYHLWVTDPSFERTYLAMPDGRYEVGEAFLTISLGEPYNGSCYKLIAAIIPRT
jgi:hypothetical protein